MLRECGSKAWPALFAADNVTFGFAADELVNDCGKPFCVAVGVLNDKFGGDAAVEIIDCGMPF